MNTFKGLKAVLLNTTLKKNPEQSHTRGLMNLSKSILEANEVDVEIIRTIDFPIAVGVHPDMTKHGWKEDAWPEISQKILDADILIIGTPIWLGEKSSECTKIIERLYSLSGKTNDKDQYLYYGKVGGCLITGNEDGAKHCAMSILYSLQHVGYTIPPQADAGWLGEIGPGPSYLDENSGGPENDFTNRNTTFMTWNLMHMARLLKDNNGIPAEGNQKKAWENGEPMDFPNPEYR